MNRGDLVLINGDRSGIIMGVGRYFVTVIHENDTKKRYRIQDITVIYQARQLFRDYLQSPQFDQEELELIEFMAQNLEALTSSAHLEHVSRNILFKINHNPHKPIPASKTPLIPRRIKL